MSTVNVDFKFSRHSFWSALARTPKLQWLKDLDLYREIFINPNVCFDVLQGANLKSTDVKEVVNFQYFGLLTFVKNDVPNRWAITTYKYQYQKENLHNDLIEKIEKIVLMLPDDNTTYIYMSSMRIKDRGRFRKESIPESTCENISTL